MQSRSASLHLFAKPRPWDGFEMNAVPGINELFIFHSARTHQPVVSNILLKLHGNHSVLFGMKNTNSLGHELTVDTCFDFCFDFDLGNSA